MDLEIPKSMGEGHVPLGGERLITKEDHLEIKQTATELGDDGVGEVARDVDAGDNPADGGTQLLDVKARVATKGEPLPLVGEVRHGSDDGAIGTESDALGHDAGEVVSHAAIPSSVQTRRAGRWRQVCTFQPGGGGGVDPSTVIVSASSVVLD